jgi:Rps23 Pro-64 3,4-dihydroxylase Tpa1-like proline 4-hydroxylase
MSSIFFSSATKSLDPFPHISVKTALEPQDCEQLLNWLETSAPWKLKIADFYEQYEFSLLDCELPDSIRLLFSNEHLAILRHQLEDYFGTELSDKVDIAAHKLVKSQRIRIHNDFIPGQETHRVLIQLNRGWSDENGGILLFFSSDNSQDLRKAFRPTHGSSVAFEISPKSNHAVSPIVTGERYTLVLSFFAHHR